MGAASLIPFILMFAVFYFLLIRPQQRKSKTRNSMLSAIKKGDKIVTIGGMHGTIMELTDDIVVLRVNDSTRVTFDRSAINSVVSSSAVAATSAPVMVKEEKAEEIKG
ncbi:preprotein translocase subunit YajC [Paenibacillus sacheonensis]|uniref:Preprotein translocase subunit YajC n=1 Tax=Paenibacillus sacheonensis TaxID=742054 RepID=A0A7X4YK63_9BACL|nr:preprotein translocase subunit YajC [Paenibacillus sacheonensis]MBM7563750.1 preprotein translocase subunit YajC [Paenibacillus sacheonensis]NBC67898.1 preprotein translocase subunit YajC [Paenibacillus sacheonensis]